MQNRTRSVIILLICTVCILISCGKQELHEETSETRLVTATMAQEAETISTTEPAVVEREPVRISAPRYGEAEQASVEIYIDKQGLIWVIEEIENRSEETMLKTYSVSDYINNCLSREEKKHYLRYIEKAKTRYTKLNGVDAQESLWFVCESRYLLATEEQLAEMIAYRGPFKGSAFLYPRQMKVIVGELDENAPRLTLEQAEEELVYIITNMPKGHSFYYTTKDRLRKYAEVDYWHNGNFPYVIFGINHDMSQYLEISENRAEYHDAQENVTIVMCDLRNSNAFVSVLDMMEQEEIPPLRTD